MTGRLSLRLKSCESLSRYPFPAQCRRYSNDTSAPPSDALGPLDHVEHQHKSFRLRKDKTSKPLPLPPSLDPVVVKERAQWEQTKAQPSVENFTPFQKKLWESPYAHVLASPIRRCRSNFIILPAALLITLHPRPHPETSDPWLLPVSLTTNKHHLGVPFRFLGRQLVAQQLGKKSGWKSGLYSRFTEHLGLSKMKKVVWREDMSDLILKLLRKRLLNKLRWSFQKVGRLVPCKSPRKEDIEEFEDVSCVLYLDTLKTRADDIQAQSVRIIKAVEREAEYWANKFNRGQDPHEDARVTHVPPMWYRGPLYPTLSPRLRFPPLQFSTTVWRGGKIPVYSLTDLLGAEGMKVLVEGSSLEGVGCVVMRRGRHNVPVEMELMQLQAYLAETGP
ncbi:hypothetical protein K504DRAFT_475117 [Pleomassaria siparia CBS 279.74]|uniref:Uncharacterized protein n=1 Tax=Pleomassaria siparia CBS 279.74 TaxID=1314801 RepID=A0A6G1JQR7_9PLEO|nr:hypothetical protein K504DRAFT_475117 [Pleomassaria siparia CBS 279.74]